MIDSKRPNPFPGLRPFRSDEHHLFFGREEQTAALLQLLRTNRFLAVVGTSGSGKSSLVRAGMIAELHGGTMTRAGSTWEVMILRPGGNPIENLARAFVEANLYDPEDPNTLPRLLATLNRSRFGLVEAMKQSDVFEPGTNLLVVVDQFEELFRFRQQGVDSEETAAAFVNLLLTASEQQETPIYVTITMRSDYLGDCSEIPGLAEAVNEGEYLIPRLLRDQKRDAIEKPIGVGAARISPLLVQRLLNDVGDDPDQLPVLQHALMRMWDVWSVGGDPDRPIDFGDFEATGGLAAALSNHADEVYDSLPDDRHRSACEKIFKALTEKGSDNRGIRRPTRLARLQAIAASDKGSVLTALDAFRGSGVTFLMPGTEVVLGDRTVLDLSHESLMRGWQRLRGWVEDEAQSARIFRRLSDTARLWKDGYAGLFRDPDLQIALSWREQKQPNAEWAEQYGGDFEKAIAFLEASNAEAQAERQAKEAARQRELEQARQLAEAQQLRLEHQQRAARRLRKLIAGLAVVAVIAGLACVAALIANQRANELADEAQASAKRAEQSRHETAEALAVVESQKVAVEGSRDKAEAAERLARAAEEEGRKLIYTTDMRLAPFVWKDDRATGEQLRLLLARHIPVSKEVGAKDAAALKPDLRGFEWHYYQHLLNESAAVYSGHESPVIDGAFTSNGELVTLDRNGQLRHWDLGTQQEDETSRRDLLGGPSAARDRVLSDDGQWAAAQNRALSPNGRLAAQAEGKTVSVFDTATGKEKFRVESANVKYRHVIFSSDGAILVVADDKLRWLSADQGEEIASVNEKYPRIQSLALSANGLTLAVVGHGNIGSQYSLFRLDGGSRKVTPLAKNLNLGPTLTASALSPDGQVLACASMFGGRHWLYDISNKKLTSLPAHASPLRALAFSGDGARLATADAEGTIKIWADPLKLTQKSAPQVTLKGHQGAIRSLCFSEGGKHLLTTSADKTARVWDLENAGAGIQPLERSRGGITVARYSPDGLLIAAPSGSKVRLWDAATGQLVRELDAGDRWFVSAIAFSPSDRHLLAVGCTRTGEEAHVLLWDIDAAGERARLPIAVESAVGVVGALAFSPDGTYLVAGLGNRPLFRDGYSNPLIVWEVASRRVIHNLPGHQNQCLALDFSKDGTLLASAGRDGKAIIWSTKTWKAVHTLENPEKNSLSGAPRADLDDVAFAPDGKTVALASREGSVQLWGVATGDLLAALKGHSGAVTAVAFSPDGRTLASGSADRTVRLWNVETRNVLIQLEQSGAGLGEIHALAFSPSGKQLLASGDDKAVWSTAPAVWNDPTRASEELQRLLQSNADFQPRIRMLSENLRLYEALAKLDSSDERVEAALAATRANWQASRQRWDLAAKEWSRLEKFGLQKPPHAWLRTPGLLRVAAALFQQQRAAEATALLVEGGKRLEEDGITRENLTGIQYAAKEFPIRVLGVTENSRASRAGLRSGDVILKIDGVELTKDKAARFADVLKEKSGIPFQVTVQRSANGQPQTIEFTRDIIFSTEAVTGPFNAFFAALDRRLGEDSGNPGLLELRAELNGIAANYQAQVADYTAALTVLSTRPENEVAADRSRLERRRSAASPAAEIVAGDRYAAGKNWEQAVAAYASAFASRPDDDNLARKLGNAYVAAGRTREAVPLMARESSANPKDTIFFLKVAALQAWFGQHKEFTATRQRVLALAKDTKESLMVIRATQVACILPSTDKAELDAALALGHTAVKVGKQDYWSRLTLGMAHYRSGDYAAADEALRAAAEAAANAAYVPIMAGFFQAMCQFRQGHEENARKLALEAAAKMPPLPADEQNPPLVGNNYHDDMILWLAYKEAKTLINFDTAEPRKAKNDKK